MRYVLDTNVWRYLLVDKQFARELDELELEPIGLSSVVASELIISVATDRALTVVDSILDRWKHAMLTPITADWTDAARALRRVRQRNYHEDVGIARRMNDALIATSCARAGWTLVTANRVDFERLSFALRNRRPQIIYLRAPSSK